MLDTSLKEQLKSLFADLNSQYVFDIKVSGQHESRSELLELLGDVVSCSPKLSSQINDGNGLEFILLKDGQNTGVKFRGIPNGHEFTSLLLAVLNSDGKGKNIPDDFILSRVKALKGPIHLTTYVSLTCTNCPDIVQALNIMAISNPEISHEMVDGAINQEEVDALKLQGVPAVFADGKLIHVGRGDFAELLVKLEEKYGSDTKSTDSEIKNYDVVVVGGGPAGCSAAIYSARKGLKVALLAERIGGQVKETVGIENLISVSKTTGEELSANLKMHMQDYSIDLLEHRKVEKVEKVEENNKLIHVSGGERFITSALIIATGASWRKLNIPGESQYIGKGVAFCPHCDGPFYKGKHVAVIGGGNSGIEAAIDLAGICSRVTVFEFMEELKADTVLQNKAKSLPNVEIILNTQTTEVLGNEKVTGLKVKDRATDEERVLDLDGIFVQIGLAPNSSVFKDLVNTNRFGEIEVDGHCRTNVSGVYAAGDVTTVPYKQIIISMGEGAKASLSAFEDRIRGNVWNIID
ncbi:alkyl hydroperoxide reductase subunit F [Dysgonomonas sp. Marseille-P4677]|uniref:alkyl hydroperoxide reductase subunit F n=1 Tax=Dysgonomonas sp. Marseille-P4677 TaxID=2364790 RepID=UPI0019132DE2|nr:alkyl hydroperoxide reductase subunit F [Dysgonomonas sp. Marseille-P4677]MBK5722503.1 alkyl hydroperoxide reductase subunit F [Dysgonomonas sp. Marseille-P4677]